MKSLPIMLIVTTMSAGDWNAIKHWNAFDKQCDCESIKSYQSGGSSLFFHSDGSSTQRVGNTLIHSDGTTSTKMGNTYFHSDGTSTQKIGNMFINSDGSSVYQSGNLFIHSDGRSTWRWK